MARSPVTYVLQLYSTLTEEQQKLFLDFVDPEPEPEAPKQTRKKRTTKSAKAQSLSSAIAKTPKVDTDSGADEAAGPNCAICGNPADHSDHDPTYLSSHVFEAPGKGKKARKNAAPTLSANAEPFEESVSAVGASAGD